MARLKRIDHREKPRGADEGSHANCAQRGFYSGNRAVLSAAPHPIHRHKHGSQRDCGHGPSSGQVPAYLGIRRLGSRKLQDLRWRLRAVAMREEDVVIAQN